ncbi:MAG: TIGR02444 family protein [Myxococcota bacterium]
MDSEPDDSASLWAFATRLYARDGVAACCLRLQDEHDLDVDVVLACVWHPARGGMLDEPTLERVLAAIAPIQARVREVRSLRRTVGHDRDRDSAWEEAYRGLKATELAAERVELSRIEATLGPLPVDASRDPRHVRERAWQGLRAYARRHATGPCDALLRTFVDLALPPERPRP